VRVLGATNRSVGALKPDFAARFKLSVAVPGLEERREDIPLLARAILRGSREHDDSVAARFFDADEPRIAPELVRALLAHSWTGHIRELESMLLRSIAESQDHFLALTHGVAAQLRARDAGAEARERGSPGRAADEGAAPTREAIERALASNHGNVSKAWKDLGLPSRDALNRLMKKLGVRR
jgi:DNA-binding NtrC family response regulator